MSFSIDIIVETDVPASLSNILHQTVVAVLQYEKVTPPASLCLLLTNDDTLQQLNRDFLGYDKPTDVLSFPADKDIAGVLDSYLGDIAISVPTAQKQANQRQYPLIYECQLLTVHGVLHLLGYDHGDEIEKKVMWEKQFTILSKLGIAVHLFDEL